MPTYGRVRTAASSRWRGRSITLVRSARAVEDAALILGVIAGFDELDPTTADVPVPNYTRAFKLQVAKLRLGLPRANFFEGLDPEYAEAVNVAIDVLRRLRQRD